MNGLNNIQAEGQLYDILAPEVVNDYVEKLGKPCTNPNGYTTGSLILATDGGNVQRLYKVTQPITSSQNIVEDGNIVRKKLGDLFDDLEVALSGEIADVDTELGNVKNALANEVTTRATLGAHNILPFPYWHMSGSYGSVPFTVAEDGLVTASGTSGTAGMNMYLAKNLKFDIGSYKLKFYGSISSAVNLRLRDMTTGTTIGNITSSVSERSFNITDDNKDHLFDIYYNAAPSTSVSINGRTAIYLTSDADTTYQPYAKTNQQLTKDDIGLTANAFDNGCVNLLGGSPTSQTVNGGTTPVYFTVNNDGTISVHTNGVATTGVANYIYTVPTIGIGRYKLSGCPTGGSDNDYFLTVNKDGGWNDASREYGNGNNITVTSSGITQVNISIRNGASIPSSSPKVFKPMITVADMPNSDYYHYIPYAKSNKELTDYVSNHSNDSNITRNETNTSDFHLMANVDGRTVTVNGYTTVVIPSGNTAATSIELGTISDSSLYPKISSSIRAICGIAANAWDIPDEVGYISINTSGKIVLKTSLDNVTKSVYFSVSYTI